LSTKRNNGVKRKEWQIAICVALLGISLSVIKALLAPITYDEAYTFNVFVQLPFSEIPRDYHFPNNHILHTLLVKSLTNLFGPSTFAIRIAALSGGILSVIFLVLILIELRASPLALPLYSLNLAVIDYGTLARGYSLGNAFLLFGLYLLTKFSNEGASPSTWRSNLLLHSLAAISFFLSVACVPTYAPAATASIIAYALVSLKRVKSLPSARPLSSITFSLAPFLVMFPALTGVLYAAILKDPKSFPWGYRNVMDLLNAISSELFNLGTSLSSSIPVILSALLLLFIVLLLIHSYRQRAYGAFIVASSIVLSVLFFSASHMFLGVLYPFARVFLYLIPLLCIMIGYALEAFLSQRLQIAFSSLLIGVSALSLASSFNPYLLGVWPNESALKSLFSYIERDNHEGRIPLVCASEQFRPSLEYAKNFLDKPKFSFIIGQDTSCIYLMKEEEVEAPLDDWLGQELKSTPGSHIRIWKRSLSLKKQ